MDPSDMGEWINALVQASLVHTTSHSDSPANPQKAGEKVSLFLSGIFEGYLPSPFSSSPLFFFF